MNADPQRDVETTSFFERDAKDYADRHPEDWKRLARGLRRYERTGFGDTTKISGTDNKIYRLKVSRGLPRIFLLRHGNRDYLLGLEGRKTAYARHVLERMDDRAAGILGVLKEEKPEEP
ncbi:hypothetical protein AKJ42_01795 [candidate division MSBL1 archaeon SCGC-AAA261C02]|uniref:Uncharacterized protein n=2 Tax=candidate division MSBL1 TaxID=215777 RepID=A0A133V0V5_9EURY|nr:hypothetical protein AKJ42_01795 [candidate division MSBL1 archaeon SCGC-AAA261C02]KXB09027.1 hypothetical protein AKJ46_01040 [candidate division MSBL1 archaeon SCGC-AAA833K04]